jgi:hypothetical protein
VILTAAELDLVSDLARDPATAAGLAARRGFALRPLTRLLDALVALGLLEKRAGAYRPRPEARALLDRDSPTSALPMCSTKRTCGSAGPPYNAGGGPRRAVARRAPLHAAFIGAMHVPARGQCAGGSPLRSGSAARGGCSTWAAAPAPYTEAVPDRRARARGDPLFDRPRWWPSRARPRGVPCLPRVTFVRG